MKEVPMNRAEVEQRVATFLVLLNAERLNTLDPEVAEHFKAYLISEQLLGYKLGYGEPKDWATGGKVRGRQLFVVCMTSLMHFLDAHAEDGNYDAKMVESYLDEIDDQLKNPLDGDQNGRLPNGYLSENAGLGLEDFLSQLAKKVGVSRSWTVEEQWRRSRQRKPLCWAFEYPRPCGIE